MKRLVKTAWLVMVTVGVSTTACNSDSDSGGGGGGVDSGVDEGKVASDATPAEAQAICEAGQDYLQSRLNSSSFERLVCRFAAVSAIAGSEGVPAAQLQDLCEVVYESCVECLANPDQEGCESFSEVDFAPEDDLGCETAEVPEDCSATVGEIENCLEASVDAVLNAFEVPACSAIDASTEPPVFEEPPMPAICEAVEEKCPAALE